MPVVEQLRSLPGKVDWDSRSQQATHCGDILEELENKVIELHQYVSQGERTWRRDANASLMTNKQDETKAKQETKHYDDQTQDTQNHVTWTKATAWETNNQHGDTTNQQGDTTNQYGDTTNQQGDTTNQQGDTTNQQGDTTNQQGDTTNQYGDTTNQHGDTTNQQGDINNQQGDTTNQYGDTTNQHGDTTNQQGDKTPAGEQTPSKNKGHNMEY
ncbi:hypothetical protein NFI96_003328 [Prochilodus magdalenae]|nr:hypothetical protein NFI96_003328 [Prochilodus magdalenae]